MTTRREFIGRVGLTLAAIALPVSFVEKALEPASRKLALGGWVPLVRVGLLYGAECGCSA